MESWPLIPKLQPHNSYGDVSHIVREVFHDYYIGENVTENTLEKLDELQFDNPDIQQGILDLTKAYHEHRKRLQEIQELEDVVFMNQSESLKQLDFIDQNLSATMNMKLKPHPVYKDIDANFVEKYFLLQRDDLLPLKIDRAMDPSFDENLQQHYKTHLHSESYSSLVQCRYQTYQLNSCELRKTKCKMAKDCPKILPSLKRFRQNIFTLCEKEEKTCQQLSKGHVRDVKCSDYVQQPKPKLIKMIAEPKNIIFSNFKLNTNYEQTLKIRNVSKSLTKFAIPQDILNSKFKVRWLKGTNVLSPGMYSTFIISFYTRTYDDAETYFRIHVQDGQDLCVPIVSRRDVVRLNGLLYYGPSTLGLYESYVGEIGIVNKILNSSIDCKSTLIGTNNQLLINFCKMGPDSSFFLVSECSWYNMNINDLSRDLVLNIPPFQIYPAYFSLKSEEVIEVNVEFTPLEFGLHLSKIMLVCDNCTFDSLDLIGDGAYFHSNLIKLQVSDKIFSVEIDTDYNSKYVLNLGSVLTNRESENTFIYITSNSVFKLNYRWELRRPDFLMKPNTTMLEMDPSWISIRPFKGVLEPEADTQFIVNVVGNSKIPGSYRFVAEFYITDIPEISLETGHTFTVVESPDYSSTGLIDILIGEVELWLDIHKASIIIDPCFIRIDGQGAKLSQKPLKFPVKIYNMCQYPLHCHWSNPHRVLTQCVAEITPSEFELDLNDTFNCELLVEVREYQPITTQFKCVVFGTDVERTLCVDIDVDVPILTPSTNVLNFGFVYLNDSASLQFKLTNFCNVLVEWSIQEYNMDDKNLQEVENTFASPRNGSLRGEGSHVEINYNLFTKKPGRIKALLVVSTSYSTYLKGSTFVLINSEIIKPTLGIYDTVSETATMRPNPGYVSVEQKCIISLRNHSPLPISYNWGEPEESELVKITICPQSGSLQSLEHTVSIITIYPKTPGFVDELGIPCYVQNNEPAWLFLEMEIKDLQVEISVSGSESVVLWPVPCPPESEIKTILDNTPEASVVPSIIREESLHYTASGMHIDRGHFSFLEEQSRICSLDYPVGMSYSTYSSRELFGSLHQCESDVDVCYEEANEGLQFCRDFERERCGCYQMYIEFLKVELKQPTKQTIKIRNMTPIKSQFCVDVKFSGMTCCPDTGSITWINTKLSGKIPDPWKWCIQSETGFGIIVDPMEGVLLPNDDVLIDVWVYGNTWGYYLDEITICLDRQEPFKISIISEIIGHPIEFPVTCPETEPILRFGMVSYDDEPIRRTLKVRNTACVPLTIVWHVFMIHVDQKFDFNLMIDIFTPPTPDCYSDLDDTGDVTKIDISLPRFYGKEDYFCFRITPRELILESEETKEIYIDFHPGDVRPNWDHNMLQAVLIGNIKLSKSDSFNLGLYKRPTLNCLEPARVHLEAEITPPFSALKTLSGDPRFTIYASEVIRAQSKRIIFRRSYVFHNQNDIAVKGSITVTDPFRLKEIETKSWRKLCNGCFSMLQVNRNSTVKVLVEFVVDYKFIEEFSVSETNLLNFMVNNKTIVLLYKMVIQPDELLKQEIPLEVVIIYPEIQISTADLDFGPVTIGFYKTLTITLVNRSASDIQFSTERKNCNPEFIVEPSTGILPCTKAGKSFPFDIAVKFQPMLTKRYYEIVVFTTGMANYFQDVSLVGTGSMNLRYADEIM